MPKTYSSALPPVLRALAAILIVKVTVSVLAEYRFYCPPDFESDFLRGREAYFWGPYRWAFFTHLISGPVSLVLGAILISEQFRKSAARWHRRLGRIHAACVLLLLTPSGLWMACYAATGAIAATGLGSLAIATAACVVQGWRAALARRFADHQRWMLRTFVLLCSAVVIRISGGLATVAQWDAAWIYPASTWASWLAPLAVFESVRMLEWRGQPRQRFAT
jgi:hypothetical protein